MRPALRSGLVTLVILGGWSSVVTASPKLTVSFKSAAVGGTYTPQNVVAVWIEGPTVGQTPGPFVKTIGRWATVERIHLVAWQAKAGPNDVDGITGATRADHGTKLSVDWDLKGKAGTLVPDGTYTVRFETADSNNTSSAQNNQGSFTFIKGLQPQVQTNLTGGSIVPYTEVTIDFNPTAGECANNIVDPGETCDPPGSCPVSCDQGATTVCAPAILVGNAATCTASCVITAITTCIQDDGCCPDGCTPTDDNDCTGNDNELSGGCTTSSDGSSGALIAFGVFGVVVLGRRRFTKAR
jgi:uncharacterized protein (TIGR03382 family)